MRIVATAAVVGMTMLLPGTSVARTGEPLQGRAARATTDQTPLTWDRVLAEMLRLENTGKDAEIVALLDRFVKTNPRQVEPYIALANAYQKQGKYAEAAAAVRQGRKAVPDMPATFVLLLLQYDVQQVTESPALPRTQVAQLLGEAVAVADQLIAAKQEVRLAMMGKSLALKLRAERVEQTAAGKQTVMAESDRLSDQARFTRADGSTIAKTVDDEWQELQLTFMTPTPGPPGGPPLEKFVAAHPDYLPARQALASYYQDLGDAIRDPAAKSSPERMHHFEAADAEWVRVLAMAHDTPEVVAALSARIALRRPDRLNKVAEAETQARAAIARYPESSEPVLSLASVLLPLNAVPTDAAVRKLREAAPATPDAQHGLATYLSELVRRNKDLPRPLAATLLSTAMGSLDIALKLRPNFVEAMVYKAVVLRQQAERVEQDPARRTALQAEADRLAEQARKVRAGGK